MRTLYYWLLPFIVLGACVDAQPKPSPILRDVSHYFFQDSATIYRGDKIEIAMMLHKHVSTLTHKECDAVAEQLFNTVSDTTITFVSIPRRFALLFRSGCKQCKTMLAEVLRLSLTGYPLVPLDRLRVAVGSYGLGTKAYAAFHREIAQCIAVNGKCSALVVYGAGEAIVADVTINRENPLAIEVASRSLKKGAYTTSDFSVVARVARVPSDQPPSTPSKPTQTPIFALSTETVDRSDSDRMAQIYSTDKLREASERGDIAAINKLLDDGAQINPTSAIGLHGGATPLYIAAENGDIATMEVLLKRGADPSAGTFFEGTRPLHAAVLGCHAAAINLLLANDCDVNSRAGDDATPLHLAAQKRCLIDELLAKGADIEAFDNTGQTALHIATKKGSNESIKALLSKGANVNARTDLFETPLHVAAESAEVDIVNTLLDKGADVHALTSEGGNPLHFAIKGKKVDNFKVLLARGAAIDQTFEGKTPLFMAVEAENEVMVKALLDAGANIAIKGKCVSCDMTVTPLQCAVVGGYGSIAEMLLGRTASAEERADALFFAAVWMQPDIVHMLLKHGVDINVRDKNGRTALHNAAATRDTRKTDIINLLLTKGAKADVKDGDGYTPLHAAASERDVKAVKILLAHGARLNEPTSCGFTPLYLALLVDNKEMADFLKSKGAVVNDARIEKNLCWAAASGNLALVRKLLANHADVNGKYGKTNLTALHMAAAKGHQQVVEELLARGADVNAKDSDDRAPLHLSFASSKNTLAIVKALIAHGADINAKTKDGDTPLDLAEESGQAEVIKILEQ